MSIKIRKLRKVNAPETNASLGSFTTGAGAVNPTVNYGTHYGVVSILRTGVGAYEITFDEAGKAYVFDYTVIWNTAAQSVIVTAVNPTTKKVNLLIVGAGGAVAADVTGLRVDFSCENRYAD